MLIRLIMKNLLMKKISCFFALYFLTVLIASTETVAAKTADSGNNLYLKAGFSVPVGRFGQSPTATQSMIASFNGKDGTGAKLGFNFELGGIYHISNTVLPEKFLFGIDGGMHFTSNPIDWSSLEMPGKYENSAFYFFGLKIGPIVSYVVNEDIILDGFFKVNPVGSLAGILDYSESGYKATIGGTKDMTFGFKKSIGVNLRYKALLLGAELNWGRINFDIKEEYSVGGGHNYTVKTPTTMVLLTAGIKF